MTNHFLKLFSSSLIVFDGGVGTELYEKGFYINRPFEELNISAPSDVIAVHLSYIMAGAQVITTNTFSISRPQLALFDIASQQEDLLRAAFKNANQARKDYPSVKVGFSVGPLGEVVEPLGPMGLDEVKSEYASLARLSKKIGGFDFYNLETFSVVRELKAAIEGIRSEDSSTPLLASLSVKSAQSELLDQFIAEIVSLQSVDAIGFNCSEGPTDLLNTLKKIKSRISKPIIIQPNAGVPRHLNGRYFYMTSPDYLAKFAKRFIEFGATGVGGCCGTGPAHISAISNALKMMSSKEDKLAHKLETIEIQTLLKKSEPQPKTSRVLKKISEGKKIFSIEVLSPKGTDLKKFNEGLDLIEAAGIDFVNIPDGARASTRASSLHLSAKVSRERTDLRAIPHFTTRDRNLIALQSDLIGAYINGVHDVLLITGDPPKLGTNKEATAVYDIDAIGLTYLTQCLNRGISPNGESLGSGTGFGIGVAANPTAINPEMEMKRWGYKVESGADFAVTQPIFDAESYLRWKEKISKQYRPHIVGIWPLISLRNAEFMANEVPGVHVPAWVIEEMEKAGEDRDEAIKRGIDIAQNVMRLLEKDCEGFCVSAPLGKVNVALEVCKSCEN